MDINRHSIPDNLLDMAREEAARAGLTLADGENGLALADGTMALQGGYSHMAARIRPSNLQRELVVRAAKLKGADSPHTAVDATAGLGEDSFILAAAGFSVTLLERNPAIAAMLLDAIARAEGDPVLSQAAGRMRLVFGDSIELLGCLGEPFGVVLLDPMFPGRQKSSAVKKKLQMLQKLERPCDDEQALLGAALSAHPRKVVVKRPAKGPHLAGRAPDYSIGGKAIRFDCLVPPR